MPRLRARQTEVIKAVQLSEDFLAELQKYLRTLEASTHSWTVPSHSSQAFLYHAFTLNSMDIAR